MSTQHKGRLAIGKVVKAFGIKGEVVVRPLTDSPQRFRGLRNAYLGRTESAAEKVGITGVQVGARGVRVMFKGITDRTAAEQIVGSLLFVEDKDRTPLPEGRYYIHDMIGIAVMDQAGNQVGTLKDVLKMPASDVYVVDVDGRDVLIPAVKEFIKKIDVEGKAMVVHLIEGMVNED